MLRTPATMEADDSVAGSSVFSFIIQNYGVEQSGFLLSLLSSNHRLKSIRLLAFSVFLHLKKGVCDFTFCKDS